MTDTITNQLLLDAAVAFVEDRARAALAGEQRASEYVEAYAVTHALQADGRLTHPDLSHSSMAVRDKAQRSLERKVKRLLDEAAADGRLLRFSSRDHPVLPRLSGTARPLHGNAVGYTTPELYRRCREAVAQAKRDAEAARDEMDALLERARALGASPHTATARSVTYDRAAFAALLDRLAGDPDTTGETT